MTHQAPAMHPRHRGNSGFTLIEVMIVVAIIGILAAVAYPSYIDSVRKGKRAEARAAVMNMLQQQERYMTQNNTYLVVARGATTSATIPFKTYSAPEGTSANSSHLLEAKVCDPIGGGDPTIRDCVKVIATPQIGVYTDPDIESMAIDTQGRRTCTGGNIARCWK